VTLDEQIQELILRGVRDAVPTLLAELGRPRLLSIRELPVSYRLILEAEKAGEIRVYRRGKYSAVDEAEFIQWMKRAPTLDAEPAPPSDEVGALIDLNNSQRKRRGGRAA
jgi:hypothetical protein